MTPRRFQCVKFCQGTSDFNLVFIQLLQIDLSKQRHMSLMQPFLTSRQNLPLNPSVQNFFAEYIIIYCKLYLLNKLTNDFHTVLKMVSL